MTLPTLEEYLAGNNHEKYRIRKLYKAAGVPPPHAGFGRPAAMKGTHYPSDHAAHQPRPYRYHFQDPLLRSQHFAYNKIKAQAQFRKEEWALTLDDFFSLWQDRWHLRGRSGDNLVMTRIDTDFPWCRANVEIITRYELICRVAALRRGIPTRCR